MLRWFPSTQNSFINMKARWLINLCITLLWFVATYHCALEQLISKLDNQPFSHTHTSSDPSSQTDCPSHSSEDPSSHSEGKSCGTILLPSLSCQPQNSAQVAFVPTANSLLVLLSNSFGYRDPFLTCEAVMIESADAAALSQLAYSLSIAPNAPPVTLA